MRFVCSMLLLALAAAPALPAGDDIPIDFPLPAWDSYEAVTLQPEPQARWRNLITTTMYGSPHDDMDGFSTVVSPATPVIPDLTPYPPAPVDRSLRAFLREGRNLTPENEAVADHARRLARDQNDAVQVLARITGWVAEQVRIAPGLDARRSPQDVLRTKAATAREAADLLSSMARSVGLPTRLCLGLRLNRTGATPHAWIEVSFSGKWAPADPGLNRIGLPASYILLARDERGDNAVSFPELPSDAILRVLSISSMNGALRPDAEDTYVDLSGDTLTNRLWRYSITRRDGWAATANAHSMRFESADGDGIVKVEALAIDVSATQETLRGAVRQLRRTLDDFREHRSEIVALGGARRTRRPAIHVDFSCTLNNRAMRCRQYLAPLRGRAMRISFWAPADRFEQYQQDFTAFRNSVQF